MSSHLSHRSFVDGVLAFPENEGSEKPRNRDVRALRA
jgi:hypothetical protein